MSNNQCYQEARGLNSKQLSEILGDYEGRGAQVALAKVHLIDIVQSCSLLEQIYVKRLAKCLTRKLNRIHVWTPYYGVNKALYKQRDGHETGLPRIIFSGT